MQDRQLSVSGLNEELEFIHQFNLERLLRRLHQQEIPALSYTPGGNDARNMLTLPGTAGVFITRRGNNLLSDLVKAVQDPRSEHHDQVVQKIRHGRPDSGPGYAGRVREEILGSETVFDIQCGNRTIMDGAILRENRDFVFIALPYCGTPSLRTPQSTTTFPVLQFNQYLKNISDPELEALVLFHEPMLNLSETEKLARLPVAQYDVLVGNTPYSISSEIWYVSTVAASSVILMPPLPEVSGTDTLREIHLGEPLFDRLSPQQLARELIAIRSKYLSHRESWEFDPL